MSKIPLVLQNPRQQDFYGPEDYTGGDWEDDEARIKKHQAEWDAAYEALTFWQRLRYNFRGYWR